MGPEFAVTDEGVRALSAALAGGGGARGDERKGSTQARLLLPKLLSITLTVLGKGATMPGMTSLVHALLWACPLLEELKMTPCWDPAARDTDLMREATELAMSDMVSAANARRGEEGKVLSVSFIDDLYL